MNLALAALDEFPSHGHAMQLAYRELGLVVAATPGQQEMIGDPHKLQRPWDPATCVDPELRTEVDKWLHEVVVWLNSQHTWDVADMIPACWASHPHLVREIAVVADQRRRAGLELTSDALEGWHRYCLPAFTDRLRSRLRTHCSTDHSAWPGRALAAEHARKE